MSATAIKILTVASSGSFAMIGAAALLVRHVREQAAHLQLTVKASPTDLIKARKSTDAIAVIHNPVPAASPVAEKSSSHQALESDEISKGFSPAISGSAEQLKWMKTGSEAVATNIHKARVVLDDMEVKVNDALSGAKEWVEEPVAEKAVVSSLTDADEDERPMGIDGSAREGDSPALWIVDSTPVTPQTKNPAPTAVPASGWSWGSDESEVPETTGAGSLSVLTAKKSALALETEKPNLELVRPAAVGASSLTLVSSPATTEVEVDESANAEREVIRILVRIDENGVQQITTVAQGDENRDWVNAKASSSSEKKSKKNKKGKKK